MTFLPIVERELRVAARHASTYWSRVSAALVCIVISAYFLYFSGVAASQLGITLFRALAWLSLLYCLLAGARLTADSVSGERREGTLGLLFLTDLKGYDVVLGKLASSSLGCLYSLLAIFPILGLSLLFGGVTAWQFWSTLLALLSALFFSLAAGMLASTLCQNPRRAAALALLIILLVTLGPLVPSIALGYYCRGPTPAFWMVLSTSPVASFALLDPRVTVPMPVAKVGYWICLGSGQIAGWLCLGLSSLLVTRVWQDRLRASGRRRLRSLWERWALGTPERRNAYRRRLLEMNPFFWLASRDRLKPAYVWGALAIPAIGTAVVYFILDPHAIWQKAEGYVIFSVALQGCLKFWIGAVVVQRLADDHHNSALELLLSTPLSTRDILHGQLLALQRQFGGPILAMLAADILFCYLSIHTLYADRNGTILIYAAHMVVLVVDVWTLVWLGSWMAVSTRDARYAAGRTLFRIVVIPWAVFTALMLSFSALDLEHRWHLYMTESRMVGLWFVLSLGNDIIQLGYATNRLREDLRATAARRFAPGAPSLLDRFLGVRGPQAGE